MSMPSELTALISELKSLLAESPTILASEQDISYFRNRSQKTSILKTHPQPPPTIKPTPIASPPIIKTIEKAPPKPPVESAPKKEEKVVEPPIIEAPPSEMPHFGTLRAILQKIAPQLTLISEIPDDTIAKKKANQWKTKNQATPISIFYSQESPAHKELLNGLAKAIDIYFGPSHLIHADPIEKENNWDTFLSTPHLQWVILCDSSLWQMPNLMRHYRENPHQKMRTLKDKRLFLLPDLSLYLKDPLLKRSLWKGLCQTLSS